MKRALLKSALGALLIGALAVPAEAATNIEGDWINAALGTYGVRSIASTQEPAKSARPPSQAVKKSVDKPAPRVQRKAPAGAFVDTGGGGQSGVASYYWQPQRVASGGMFNPNAMTAAHKTLPFGTKVRVTHQATGRAVTVTINDRGPYIAGRVIDLSLAAAGELGMKSAGIAKVSLTVLGR